MKIDISWTELELLRRQVMEASDVPSLRQALINLIEALYAANIQDGT